MTSVIDAIVDPLTYPFMQRAFLATIIAALVCGLLSCWLVLLGWSLMGDAVSHAVLPGVVLAYVVDIPFTVGALVFALIAVGLIGLIRDTSRVREDAVIGVVFTTLFALGLVLRSKIPSQVDLGHILFGSIVGVTRADLAQIVILGALAAGILLVKRRDLTLFAFDPTHAHAIGLSPRRLSALLLVVLALTVVVSLQTVGVILVVALLVIPGATAYLVTDSFRRMLILAPSLAVASAVAGIYLAHYSDASSGGTIVLVLGGCFLIAYLFAPQRGIITARLALLREQRRTQLDRTQLDRTQLDRSQADHIRADHIRADQAQPNQTVHASE